MNFAKRNTIAVLIAGLLLWVLLEGCDSIAETTVDDSQLKIVTTTGMIKDAMENIVKNKATVESLMGPGVDPHLYKPTSSDLSKLKSADVIVYNGLHLEGKMTEIFQKLSKTQSVLAMSDALSEKELRTAPEFVSAADPHIWFNVNLWAKSIKHSANFLEKHDSKNAEYYKKNLEVYLSELGILNDSVFKKIQRIPKKQRVLITTHDAFRYFGEAYQIEVKGLQGVSTASEVGLRDITDMVDFIIERDIEAVFVESSVSAKTINAVIEGCNEKGHVVKNGGILYADAMGAEGTEEGTYIGMVKANVDRIVNALL